MTFNTHLAKKQKKKKNIYPTIDNVPSRDYDVTALHSPTNINVYCFIEVMSCIIFLNSLHTYAWSEPAIQASGRPHYLFCLLQFSEAKGPIFHFSIF